MSETWQPESAARWLVEAVETGSPLHDLPADIAPRDAAAGEAVAVAVLESLLLPACGVRLLRLPDGRLLAGPMLESRLVRPSSPLARNALRHPRVTAAAIGVLAEALAEEGHAPPRFTALHAAIDIADSRFTEWPGSLPLLAADLGALGLVVAGRPRTVEPGVIRLLIGPPGARRVAHPVDLTDAFAAAAIAARRFGGLPAGALLVVAGLSAVLPAEGQIAADLGPLGKLSFGFA